MRFLPLTYAARNLGRSPARLAMSVGGGFLVSLLAMAGMAFVLGMDGALRASGHPRNVILLGAGSEESAERSEIAASTPGVVVASLRGLATIDGVPLASPEVNVALTVDARPQDADVKPSTGIVRGITPAAFLVHPQVRLVAGRAPEAGADELALGRSAARAAGIDPDCGGGPTVAVDGRPFRVVGAFEAPGTVMDGEAWMPIGDVLVLTKRETVSAVIVALAPGATPGQVDAFAQRRVDLELSAIPEPDYYAVQAAFYRPVQAMVVASAALVAVGAMLGGLNTMYAAFASRIREIAMLQVIGFSRAAIVTSMVQEALIASMAGALAAAVVAIVALDGRAVQFSMGTFGLSVDERVIAVGLASGILAAVAGCAMPAWRCLRMSIPSALKSD
jgi:putative ABC transport system permease protein